MKKIICLVTLAILLLPMIAFAQSGPKTCCELKSTIKYEGDSYKTGAANIWISETIYTAPALPAERPCGPANITAAMACSETGSASNATSCWTSRWGMICTLNTVNRIFNVVFVLLMALVGIMVIIGAFNIVTAGGDPQKVTSGKNYIMYAVLGLVVALFAKAIPAIVMLVI
jgi:hypothetical protein